MTKARTIATQEMLAEVNVLKRRQEVNEAEMLPKYDSESVSKRERDNNNVGWKNS